MQRPAEEKFLQPPPMTAKYNFSAVIRDSWKPPISKNLSIAPFGTHGDCILRKPHKSMFFIPVIISARCLI